MTAEMLWWSEWVCETDKGRDRTALKDELALTMRI